MKKNITMLCVFVLCSCPLLVRGQERDADELPKPPEKVESTRRERAAEPLLLDEPLPPPPKGPVAYGGPRAGVVDIGRLREELEKLGVSPAEAGKIAAEAREYLKMRQKQHITLRRLELDIREQLLEDRPDLRRVKSLVDKKTKILADIEYERIKRDVEARVKLTEEQYEAWRRRMPER